MSRLSQTLRMWTILTSTGRTKYLKEKRIFGAIGDNCSIQDRRVPLYAKLIKLGNNVRVASNVTFITHDIIHKMLNNNPTVDSNDYEEKVGCIEIQDNVFIGAGSTILYDVSVGSNVIIGAGSLVNKDIPPNSVVGGVPAKVICSFNEYIEKRKNEIDVLSVGEAMDEKEAEWFWNEFYNKRKM